MMGRRPDLLDGLPAALRLRRERQDTAYLTQEPIERYVHPTAADELRQFIGGNPAPTGFQAKPLPPDAKVDVVVCARVDLDHPIYFADNIITECADCGCDVQHRPHAPATGDRLCVCCAARRLREERSDG